MAELDSPDLRRSSSLTSSSSRKSQKAKAVGARSQKRLSGSSDATKTDLTSFPSLSPAASPDGFLEQPALNPALTRVLLENQEGAATSDSICGRRNATLATLTSPHRLASGRAALFDDAVPTNFPGILHLADDAHIERLIASVGPVKLVRQFAHDLAVRDAEISVLRQRADARERELKKMLREAAISNQDIERRLYLVENPLKDKELGRDSSDHEEKEFRPRIDGLMMQAMRDEVGSPVQEDLAREDDDSNVQATIRAKRLEGRSSSRQSSTGSGTARKRENSSRGWQDYIFGSISGSRKTSRTSSVMSDLGEREEHSDRVPTSGNVTSTNRRKLLDEQLFQPPDVRTTLAGAEAAGSRFSKKSNDDDASVHSRKSSKSITWTIKLFAGNTQASFEGGNSIDDRRGRASSTNRQASRCVTNPANTFKSGTSAVAALKRINSSTPNIPGRSVSGPSKPSLVSAQARRTGPVSTSQAVSTEDTIGNPTNLGPVEMDAILPLESQPPTLTHTYNNYQPGEFLTDRFGFIYDQRRKRRQREANLVRNMSTNRLNKAETLSSFRIDASDADDDDDVDDEDPKSQPPELDSQDSSTSISAGVADAGGTTVRRWQDYLKLPSRPTELLSHTPSAGPIVSLTTAGETPESRSPPLVALDKTGSVAVCASAQPSASTSTVVADNPEFAGTHPDLSTTALTLTGLSTTENEPVRLLLEQLTDLHDSLQRERTVRWNEFLRKVRAERRKEGAAAATAAAAAAASGAPVKSAPTPEASLADGEIIGIANLGNKGKVGRAKWREFRSLVLGGIPVTLRAKIWSECSGASAMRIPGYYEDLVRGIGGEDPDASVVAQIDMDIHRTLTDNVFFRKGPGVSKLREVLLAYARRNSEVGYCQGMNLIAASLLLITPAAEDAFWLLGSLIEVILPQHYYDHGLLASRADQVVLRQYITQTLPKLSSHLDTLGVELEALTFQWFLSVFTDCLSAEALYRVWDVIFCLNVTSGIVSGAASSATAAATPDASSSDDAAGSGGGSTFLFQVALALLKLNEQQLLTTCSTPAALYTYINHQMTNHAISIDGLLQASEALRNVVRREDVVARRAVALREME